MENKQKGLPAMPAHAGQAGVTLVEIVVVIFIISLFSLIVIDDFPAIEKQSALSGATYKLEQDIRSAEDLGLSGVQTLGSDGSAIKVKGYGVYFNLGQSATQYLIYADVNGDGVYNGDFNPLHLCSNVPSTTSSDCIVNTVDITKQNGSLFINGFDNVIGSLLDINFVPPGPSTMITNISQNNSQVGIILTNGIAGSARTVYVNTSGLISTN